MDVVDALEHLFEEVSADVFLEGARVGDIVEELTALDHLLSNVGDIDGATVALDPLSLLLEFKVFDDMSVLQLGGGIDLFLEQLEGFVVEVGVVEAEDLESILGTVLGSGVLDLGGEA